MMWVMMSCSNEDLRSRAEDWFIRHFVSRFLVKNHEMMSFRH